MKKIKLGDVLDVKRGTSLSGDYYATSGDFVRLTLGNFNYPDNGFKNNTSKDDIYFNGTVKKEFVLNKGDIITPLTEQVRGLLGNTATIPESNKYIQSGDIGLIIPNEELLDKRFAYYLVSSPIVKKQLDAGSQQTKIRHTSPDKIKDCIAYIPEIEEQRKIAQLLDGINAKIELNNEINDNLCDLIKLIYDKTFYNHNKCDNTHWVQEFSINIPKDWKVVKLSTLIDNISTGLNPRNNFTLTDKGYKYVTVKNLTSKGSLNFQGCDYIDEEARKIVHSRSQVSKGDILFASISPLGRCYAVNENPTEWEINESVFSITPKNEILQLYLYMYLTSDYFIKKAEHSSTGSIFSGIRISTLGNMPIILPTETTLDEFTNIVRPLFNKRDNIDKENAKLKELRNYLLPLLMNGQIVIAD